MGLIVLLEIFTEIPEIFDPSSTTSSDRIEKIALNTRECYELRLREITVLGSWCFFAFYQFLWRRGDDHDAVFVVVLLNKSLKQGTYRPHEKYMCLETTYVYVFVIYYVR